MFDLFLVSDQQLFELDLRGELTGAEAVMALTEALGRLPVEADVLLDLADVTRIDEPTAAALRVAILDRRAAGGSVAIVAPDLDVRLALAAGDVHHVAGLAATRAEALHLLPGCLAA